MSAVLSAHHLTTGYVTNHHRTIVHSDLSFTLHRGSLTCLLGANGTGKSTLLRTLSSMQPSLQGEVRLMDAPLAHYSHRELSRLVGVVLTDRTSAGGLRVEELVALGRQPPTGLFGHLGRHDIELVGEALAQVGMSHKAHHYVAQLSDGERQKAMIAKALVQECPIILLDEPTAFLDVVSRIDIMLLLHRLASEGQKAILLSTHDVDQALLLADHLWLLTPSGLTSGQTEDLVLSGQLDKLFPQPHVRFENLSGTFRPLVRGERRALVTAASPLLQHWTVNALQRAGFDCTDLPSCGLRVEALSPTAFLITRPDGSSASASSVAEMLTLV